MKKREREQVKDEQKYFVATPKSLCTIIYYGSFCLWILCGQKFICWKCWLRFILICCDRSDVAEVEKKSERESKSERKKTSSFCLIYISKRLTYAFKSKWITSNFLYCYNFGYASYNYSQALIILRDDLDSFPKIQPSKLENIFWIWLNNICMYRMTGSRTLVCAIQLQSHKKGMNFKWVPEQ